MLGAIWFDRFVESRDVLGRPAGRLVDRLSIFGMTVIADWKNRGEYDTNSVGPGELRHGGQVVLDHGKRSRAGVSGDVVGTCKDYDDFGSQRQDVGPKPNQHLRSSLAADASVYVRLSWHIGLQSPPIGNRIAREQGSGFVSCGRRELGVGFAIAAELRPVGEPSICPG